MVISIVLVLVGSLTILSLPVAQFPSIAPPEIQIVARLFLAMQVGRLGAKKIRAGGTLLFPALRSTKLEVPAPSAH